MRTVVAVAVLALGLPGSASAHVTIQPAESRPGIEQRYTVRVPTEGQVATISVELEVPEAVTVIDVAAPDGAKHDVKRSGERIVAIAWTKDIPPKQTAQFVFVARNPHTGERITWNVQQRFADGSSRAWTPGTKLPMTAAATGIPRSPFRRPHSRIKTERLRWVDRQLVEVRMCGIEGEILFARNDRRRHRQNDRGQCTQPALANLRQCWRWRVHSPIRRQIRNDNRSDRDVGLDIHRDCHELVGLEVRIGVHESFERSER